jgi:hypothetical protein
MDSQFRLRELLLGTLLLGIVFAIARAALFMQVEQGQPDVSSVSVEIVAGSLLGLTAGAFLVRMFGVSGRRSSRLIYACCFVLSIPGLAAVVSLTAINL